MYVSSLAAAAAQGFEVMPAISLKQTISHNNLYSKDEEKKWREQAGRQTDCEIIGSNDGHVADAFRDLLWQILILLQEITN